jgi:hypothetical protein
VNYESYEQEVVTIPFIDNRRVVYVDDRSEEEFGYDPDFSGYYLIQFGDSPTQ